MSLTCELWDGPTFSNGYGQHGGRGAHRVAYEQVHGPIPKGLVVRHTCDNKLCINPAHLLLGTQADNIQDKCERQRQAKGTAANKSKLTDEDIRSIRKSDMPQTRLAVLYNVTQSAISRIQSKQFWKHIT